MLDSYNMFRDRARPMGKRPRARISGEQQKTISGKIRRTCDELQLVNKMINMCLVASQRSERVVCQRKRTRVKLCS